MGAALEDRTVAVLAVDTVLRGADPELLRRFEDSGATAGLLLQAVEDPRAFGVALLEGERIVDLEEKPEQPRSNLALVGLWLLAPEAVERVRTNPYINAKGESDLTATVAALLGEGRDLRGWTLDGEWLDGGTLEGCCTHSRGCFRASRRTPERAVPRRSRTAATRSAAR